MHATSLSGLLPLTERAQEARGDSTVNEAYLVGDYWIEVYHNPSTNLNLRSQEELIQECMPVVHSGFGQLHVDKDVVRRHLLDTSTSLVIRDESNRVVGVAGSSVISIDEYRVIYLQGGTISKECRDYGLYKVIVATRVMAEVNKMDNDCVKQKKIFIGTRTQNPIIYKFMHRKLKMFPYTNGYINNEVKYIATKFSNFICDNYNDFQCSEKYVFDHNTFVARKAHRCISDDKNIGLSIYGYMIPFCKDDDEINQYMKDNLHWNNGDALIMLGYYSQQDVLALFHGQRPELHPSIGEGVQPLLARSGA